MNDQTSAPRPKGIDARITDADIERGRRQIGVPQYERNPPFNMVATSDAISHFAFGIGDDNPLWHDPAYGRSTRWREQIAPPLFATATGIDETPPPSPELKELFRGLFRGVGRYYSGASWQWFKPIYPGDVLYREMTTSDITIKENSSFSGGKTVIDTYRYLYVDRTGTPVCAHEKSFVNAERGASRSKGKHKELKRQTYTKEELEKIDAAYEAEERRGREQRFWEDVNVGDMLVPVVKGPMRVVDIIGFHIGWGFGQDYGAGPLRYGWKHRKRMPNFYVEDQYGVPDIVQRMHWDQQRAEDIGLPAPYDYGAMRTNWLAHLLTNWMGDDGWLYKLSTQMRSFNFLGDTTTCTGEVVGKRVEGPHHLVDIKVAATNQRGQVSTPGTAVVVLPSRAAGAVLLPDAPLEWRQRGVNMMTEAAARLRG